MVDFSSSYYPAIISTLPAATSTGISRDTEIEIRFSLDIALPHDYEEDEAGLNAQLNELVTLFPTASPMKLPVVFADYDTSHYLLTIAPSADLTPGETYTIICSREFRSVGGRGMTDDYTWSFTVDDYGVDKVLLIDPADNTYYASVPTLSWYAASGASRYTIEIADTLVFSSADIVYTASVSGTSLDNISASEFRDGTTYYWRVCGLDADGGPGPWSDTRAFRIDSTPDTAPASRVRDVFTPFAVSVLYPEQESVVSVGALSPVVTFSRDVDASSLTGKVTLSVTHVDGESVASSTISSLAGTVSDAVVLFDPITVESNKLYTIILAPGISSTDGKLLSSATKLVFTGPYVPLYSSSDAVRSLYGEFLSIYSDADIVFQLHRNSVLCNKMIDDAAAAATTITLGSGTLLEDLLTQKEVTYEIRHFVEIRTAYCLIQNYQFQLLREVDRRTQVDTYTAETGARLLQEIADILAKLKDDMTDAEVSVVSGGAPYPEVGVRSSRWRVANLYDDWSTARLRRGKF